MFSDVFETDQYYRDEIVIDLHIKQVYFPKQLTVPFKLDEILVSHYLYIRKRT